MSTMPQRKSATYQGRAAARVKLRGRAFLSFAGGGEAAIEVELEDLSVAGAGIVAGLDVPAGSAVVVMLELLNHPPHGIRGHVTGSKPVGENQYRIGVEFDIADGPTIQRIRYAFFPDALG
jgi:hypothetical protein